MFCYIFGKTAVDELFYSRFTFKISFFFRFFSAWGWLISQGNHATISNITMSNWFEKCLVSYRIIAMPKVSHTRVSIFLQSQRSLPAKRVFERILTKAFCQYIPDLILKKKLGSFNDWINNYFQFFIFFWWYGNFLTNFFFNISLELLNRI